jgi:putative methyltransferase (TIGR04325 family)
MLRELTPPILLRMVRRGGRSGGLRFEGDYATWQDARRASGGYDKENIVRRVYEAELEVKNGHAADARDGVPFEEMQFSLPVMAALTRAAARRGGVIRVVDFGGAFGGLYRQYKALAVPGTVFWTVVEQESFVGLGRAQFQNAELGFVATLEEALAAGRPDVLLLSSVLQYLSEPYAMVSKVTDSGAPHVVIDRTPCSELDRDVLTVQTVPPAIYRASYPCWIFSRERLLGAFAPGYRTLAAFTDGSGRWHNSSTSFELAGFLLDRQAGTSR